jgi:uncharacterized membrane protein
MDIMDLIYTLLDEFTEKFLLGFFFGVLAVSSLLFRNYGLSFCLDPLRGQLHITSIDLMCFTCVLAYYVLGSHHYRNGKRVFLAMLFAWMSFYVHDIWWVVDSSFTGSLLSNGIYVTLTRNEVTQYLSRNLVYIGVPLLFLWRSMKFNRYFWICLIPQIILHTCNILYNQYDYSFGVKLMIAESIDMLPFLWLLHKKHT